MWNSKNHFPHIRKAHPLVAIEDFGQGCEEENARVSPRNYEIWKSKQS